eukprot:5097653-Prymnesium_polylepis.1
MQSLKDKSGALSPNAPAPVPPAVQKPVASIWIMQKNVNPSYLTVREITYASKKWYFDSSDKKNDPSASATRLTRRTIVVQLAGLGSFTAVRKTFKPKVGNKVTYSFNNHTYEVE